MNAAPMRRCLLPVLALASGLAACSAQNFAGAGYAPQLPMQSYKVPRTPAEVFTTNDNPSQPSVLGFKVSANGDVKPKTIIAGSNTMLTYPSALAIDADLSLYVTNNSYDRYQENILVFASGSNGNVSPSRVIGGSNTKLVDVGGLAVDASGYLWASDYYTQAITAYAPGANGNVSPTYDISGSNTELDGPDGIAFDQEGRLYVADFDANSVLIFAKGANGNVAPTATISGSNTGLSDPVSVAIDTDGRAIVSNQVGNVLVFAAGASGNAAPVQTITSVWAHGVTTDSTNDIWVANTHNSGAIDEFTSTANGDATPLRVIKGHKTKLSDPVDLVLN
jgi:sugar lactone lactonase YvrE